MPHSHSANLSRYLDAELLERIADRGFQPRWLVEGQLAGAHKSPRSGFAIEFAGHREYVAGDDPKHIDWRVYYNRDKYFVKQYEMETNFVCHLVIDISSSMRYGDAEQQKLLAAARLASVIAFAVVKQSDKVSFTTVDDAIREHLPPSDSFAQVARIVEHLDRISATNETDLGACLAELAGRLGSREIVVVLSDFFCDVGSLEKAIQRLRYQGHEVVLFQVMHRDELLFDLTGLTRFDALEAAPHLVADPHDVREYYLRALDEFRRQVREAAELNAGEYALVDTSRTLAETVADYLQRRNLAGVDSRA